jgi:hypothetical protein
MKNLPRTIARAVLANLHESIVPLIYSTITPTSYVVYLHPDDFAGVEGIVPALAREINRALDEEIAQLEHPRWWHRLLHPTREKMPPIEPSSDRVVEIAADPNGEIERGEVGVHSELRLPSVDYAGTRTVRVTSTTSVSRATRRHDVPMSNTSSPAPPGLLVIDDLDGRREHALVDNPTLVGRGGLGATVHLRLRTEGVVSKEHCRVRWDDRSGEFFIKDLSRNGTFVNGTRLPAGADFTDGQRR